ncbi:collagen-like protein [Ascidiimonas aurantiaca]|uniref:collagen-like protein n=1 Tax=Ascidiimonas aurantiaca TaxID=1685432 RepID=UPI0030EEB840
MKKLLSLLAFTSILFISCEGDPGPPGPPGPRGEDGFNIVGVVFEEIGVNFTQANNYKELIPFPENIEVLRTDIVLVYLLEDVVNDGVGGTADLWTLLPKTIFTSQGTLQYNFNHSFFDVEVSLEADFNLNNVPQGLALDQVFRIAIIPADEFSQMTDVNLNSMQEVMQALNKTQKDIIKTF